MAWQHRTHAAEQQILALSPWRSIKEVAALTGCSPWTVFDVRRKYHWVDTLGRQHVARRRYRYDEHTWGRVLEALYVEQQLTQEEVAARCGVDVGTIRRRLTDLGFRIREGAETRTGRARGPYRRQRTGPPSTWPTCDADDCTRRVRTAGETTCSTCRR